MTTFKLPSKSEKASYVLDQFDRIARRYDLANDVISMGMHRLWKARAVDALSVTDGGQYLDVCTGTGDMALRISSRFVGAGSVTGIDFSAKMLEIASARTDMMRRAGRIKNNIQTNWHQGDAQKLPFADNSFDGAVISFGLRNLTDLQQGLAEMVRVVRPGGAVVSLDLGHPTAPVFTPVYLAYFKHIVPVLGDILQGDRMAYTYLPESLRTYPKERELKTMFEAAGATRVSFKRLAVGSVALHSGLAK